MKFLLEVVFQARIDVVLTLRSTTMGFWQILSATDFTSGECSVAENMSTCAAHYLVSV